MSHLDRELEVLINTLLNMASHAESSVRQAVQAFETRDDDLALRVRAEDAVIDRFEVEVDELSLRLLARAPLGRDLRLIAVIMKISPNLERVGDEAAKLANRVRALSQEPPLPMRIDIRRLADLSVALLKRALDAFTERNSALARSLIPEDQRVDELNRDIHGQLAHEMIQNPASITRCLNLIVVAKRLERVADHAKNIAQAVVFLCEGMEVRQATSSPPEPASVATG